MYCNSIYSCGDLLCSNFLVMTKQLIAIFIGGGIGSVVRYVIALVMSGRCANFPWSTLLTNVVGSLIIGYLMGYFVLHPNRWEYTLLVVGFCGGFTTFSTFSYETVSLLKNGQATTALLYMAASLVLCVVCTFGAFKLSELIYTKG